MQGGEGGNGSQGYWLACDATFFHGEDNFFIGGNKLIEFLQKLSGPGGLNL